MNSKIKLRLALFLIILLPALNCYSSEMPVVDSAEKVCKERLASSLKLNFFTLTRIRVFHKEAGNLEGQLHYLNQIIRLYEENSDIDGIISKMDLGLAYGRRWLIHEELGNEEKASKNRKKALTIFKEIQEDVDENSLRKFIDKVDGIKYKGI